MVTETHVTHSIWKFPLAKPGTVLMPKGAVILTAQLQYGLPTLWARVNPKAPMVPRRIGAYLTGGAVPADPGVYLGTFQFQGGDFVKHLFDRGEEGG